MKRIKFRKGDLVKIFNGVELYKNEKVCSWFAMTENENICIFLEEDKKSETSKLFLRDKIVFCDSSYIYPGSFHAPKKGDDIFLFSKSTIGISHFINDNFIGHKRILATSNKRFKFVEYLMYGDAKIQDAKGTYEISSDVIDYWKFNRENEIYLSSRTISL